MFDDIFEMFGNHKRRHGRGHGHGYGYEYEDDHHYREHNNSYYAGPQGSHQPQSVENSCQRPNDHGSMDPHLIVSKVLQNKQLLVIAACAMAVVLIVVIAALILLTPVLLRLLGVVEQHGLKGIIDGIFPILIKIWEGQKVISGK